MRSKEVSEFKRGLITSIEANSIPDGAASRSLNWQSLLDRIALVKGYLLFGTEISGVGRSTGVHVAFRADGTQVMFRKRARKLEYHDTATDAWLEVGTDIFPAAAVDDEMSFSNYSSLAGAQMFFGSPNSSLYKIMTANPGSYADQYVAAKNFKGFIKIKQNRTFLWGRNEDKTGVYGSWIDNGVNNYTTVTAEALGTGDGADSTFSGTLAFKAGNPRNTCFALAIKVNSVATLTDDYNGNLKDSNGVTRGTINYMTGAYDITFAAAVPLGQAITADYQHEDSTDEGIMDFSKSTPRTAGQGFIFRQDDGGEDLKSVESYGDVEYCLHRLKTWALTLTATDTGATNLIYRDRVGIPNTRAAVPTGDGVYYVDDLNETDPKFRLLTLQEGGEAVIPLPVSDQLNLVDYRFDQAATIEWGDYVLFACRHKDADANDTVFAYNKRFRLWDKLDYFVSCFAIYNGALVAGDSISYNVYELFAGFSNPAVNYWEGNLSDLDIQELKKTRRFWTEGEIARDQTLKISLSIDNGPFVEVGTQTGSDSNVDTTARTIIGSDAIGSSTLGGQTSSSVYHYLKEIRLTQGKFWDVKVRFEALRLGYVSVSKFVHQDILVYGAKLPTRYRALR
jgi:hypothetical protein